MTSSAPTSLDASSQFQRDAFNAIQPEIAAVDAKTLPRITLDIRQAVMTAVGCMPELKPLKARLKKALPEVDPELFEKLERYAFALGHAQTQYVVAAQPAETVPELTDKLKALVDVLQSDAIALSKRGLVDPTRLAQVPGTNGSKNTAASAFILVELFRKSWDKIGGRTAVPVSELDETESLANRLEIALGVKEQGPVGVPEASLTRQKAYALFVRAYDQVRRVVTYLRWEDGDIDKIVPSLYAGRFKKSGSELEQDQAAPATGQPVAPAPTNGTAPANGPTPVAADPNAAPGMPGNPPFIRT